MQYRTEVIRQGYVVFDKLELASLLDDTMTLTLVIKIGGHKMFKNRNVLIVIGMLFCSVAFADVQVNIGISVPVYPNLVVVPGYPVYYAPQIDSNYFFYDGLYCIPIFTNAGSWDFPIFGSQYNCGGHRYRESELDWRVES